MQKSIRSIVFLCFSPLRLLGSDMQVARKDPISNLLKGKRVVLASQSARRQEILTDCLGWSNFEIIPSTFEETLPHSDYEGREDQYPVDTAAHKVFCRRSTPTSAS